MSVDCTERPSAICHISLTVQIWHQVVLLSGDKRLGTHLCCLSGGRSVWDKIVFKTEGIVFSHAGRPTLVTFSFCQWFAFFLICLERDPSFKKMEWLRLAKPIRGFTVAARWDASGKNKQNNLAGWNLTPHSTALKEPSVDRFPLSCNFYTFLKFLDAPLWPCDFEEGFCQWFQSHNGDFHWRRYKGETPSMNTGPTMDHTKGNGEENNIVPKQTKTSNLL